MSTKLSVHQPPEIPERTAAIVWPSIAQFRLGRAIGQMAQLPWGIGPIFTLGKLLVLLMIPVALVLYLAKFLPGLCRRYRVTTRRVIIEGGLRHRELASIAWGDFDSIKVHYPPGAAWMRAGDLVLYRGDQPVFRLPAVPTPETFRQICVKVRRTTLSFEETLERLHQAGTATATKSG